MPSEGLELDAVTINALPEVSSSVGVPLITPVEVSKLSPRGSGSPAAAKVQEVTVPPVSVGVMVTGVPLVKVYEPVP